MGALGILLRRHADDYGIGFCFCFHGVAALAGFGAGDIRFWGVFSNTVMLGIPIILTAFGPAASPLFMVLAFHGLLVFTTALVCRVHDQGQCPFGANYPTIGPRYARQMVILGLLAGVIWNFSGLALAAPVDRFLDLWAVPPFPSR